MKYNRLPANHANCLDVQRESLFKDERGAFMPIQPAFEIAQTNISYSKRGVARGLHTQLKPFAQTKLVTVIDGCIIDYYLNIETGEWDCVELCKGDSILIPNIYAHGFITSTDATVMYSVDVPYSIEHEVCYDMINICKLSDDYIMSGKDVNDCIF